MFITDGHIQKTVSFGFPHKFFHVRCRQIKKLKRALLTKHSDKPCLAMGFLLVFQHCINKQRKILRRQSRQLEGYFGPFKGKSDDLVGRIASVVQSAFSFHRSKLLERLCFAFSGAGSLEKESTPGNQGQAGTGIPFHSDLPDIVYIGNGAFCTRRRSLRIIHVI